MMPRVYSLLQHNDCKQKDWIILDNILFDNTI